MPEDEVGHGTHVAGIIAARGVEMDEGVAPACSLMAVRVLATMKSTVEVARRAGNRRQHQCRDQVGIDVFNGATTDQLQPRHQTPRGGLPHDDVIRYALSKNVTVVAASGNDGTAERYYPARCRACCAVGAIDESGNGRGLYLIRREHHTVSRRVLSIYSSFARDAYAVRVGNLAGVPVRWRARRAHEVVCASSMGSGSRTCHDRRLLRTTSDRAGQPPSQRAGGLWPDQPRGRLSSTWPTG